MKAFISQPMAGKTQAEIEYTRNEAIKFLNKLGYEIEDTYFGNEMHNKEFIKENGISSISLYYLAKSLEGMSKCEAVYFCSGWEGARGCRCEHGIAQAYGLKMLYEDYKEIYNV